MLTLAASFNPVVLALTLLSGQASRISSNTAFTAVFLRADKLCVFCRKQSAHFWVPDRLTLHWPTADAAKRADVANKHSTVNTLSLELQAKLRKRQHPFPKAGMHGPPRCEA
jgi:hypothetical protein